MQNFEYCVPTKVVFGRDTESRCGELVRECGGTHALVVYGGGSAVRSGLLGRCTDSLKAAGIPYELLGGVQPNPRLSRVREGIALAKETGADFLLAVGGGSVIDTAKAIGYALANPEFDIWDLFMGKATAKACAPVGAVLTISAAGSETSNSCVITNEDGWLKKGVNYECSRPRFAIMNPALTCTLPPYQTASGGVDIMMHTMERYFSNTEHTELLDRMSEGLLKTVMANTKKALAEPNDYDARAELMWAGQPFPQQSYGRRQGAGLGDAQDRARARRYVRCGARRRSRRRVGQLGAVCDARQSPPLHALCRGSHGLRDELREPRGDRSRGRRRVRELLPLGRHAVESARARPWRHY